MEYGLCCLFYEEPIKFKTYTYAGITKLLKDNGMDTARNKVLGIWQHNVDTLQQALDYCKLHNFNSYRIGSDLLPQLHRMVADGIATPSHLTEFTEKLQNINSYEIKLSMHPGQHVNMGSPTDSVIINSVRDLKDHFFVAKPLNCTEINIHVGGAYGDKVSASKRFIENMKTKLTSEELSWMTIENDELNFHAGETIAICNELGIRMTFDLHHQRCYELKYGMEKPVEYWFHLAGETWKNYDYQRLHISSPRDGYTTQSKSRPHHNFINPVDIPKWLIDLKHVHVDIEAKAKEKAIFQLRESLNR